MLTWSASKWIAPDGTEVSEERDAWSRGKPATVYVCSGGKVGYRRCDNLEEVFRAVGASLADLVETTYSGTSSWRPGRWKATVRVEKGIWSGFVYYSHGSDLNVANLHSPPYTTKEEAQAWCENIVAALMTTYDRFEK